jgi:hypothetical protein
MIEKNQTWILVDRPIPKKYMLKVGGTSFNWISSLHFFIVL